MPARYALERGAWNEAAELSVPATGPPFTIAITHFARALGAARDGRPDDAREELRRLAERNAQLEAAEDAYWAEQVRIQAQVASAWIAFAEGRTDEALREMHSAADAEDATDKSAVTPGPLAPARELLGEMLLEAGRARDALRELEATMRKEPGRFRGAHGAARAAQAAGLEQEARRYYERVLEIARDADSARAELEQARSFVAATEDETDP
jgi:tetratricopeptide (TPR) repeat protein